MFGLMSCVRISRAKKIAMTKKTSAVAMYIAPILLWSVVVSQAPRPPRCFATSAATGTASGSRPAGWAAPCGTTTSLT